MKISAKERFERKMKPWIVKANECQLWVGAKNQPTKKGNGHGRFYLNGSYPLAHRVSYELYVGPIPDGMQVLHRCDNPMCVNPNHLFLGTQKDNVSDMNAKGRAVNLKREAHGMAKLNAEKAFEIRWSYATGKISSRRLANWYGVSRRTIQNVYQNKFWPQECHD